MRIGIDCRMYSARFTGIGRYVFELVHFLAKIDRKNQYILFFNEPEYSQFKATGRFQKVLVNAPHYSFREQAVFLKILNAQKLDLMHFTHFNRPIFYFRRSIVTIHDLTLSFFPGRKMHQPWYRAAYHFTVKSAVQKARQIIAVSNNTKKDLHRLFRLPESKITVIYEGVNSQFYPIKDTKILKVTQNKYKITTPYLLYTGVWRSHKNLINLIKAFKYLKNQYTLPLSLVLTGRRDPIYAPEIEAKIRELSLENDVIFTGLVDDHDLVALYNGASAYVFPSLYEGFGLPPLEAMQCGVPVIASRTSSIPEICGENNALFFDPNDPQNMAEQIFKVLAKPALRQELIGNGLNRCQEFSWQKMAEQTLAIYESNL